MPTLNILTTATPRPEIHELTVIKAVDKLLSFGLQDRIEWYINVDKPSMFTEQARTNTVDNFLSFYRPGLKTHIMADHQSAHFGAAARRLYTSCEPSGTDNIFLWLEDDWVLNEDEAFLRFYLNFFRLIIISFFAL